MMPGIFQHVGKMAGIGSIEPPSFDQEDDDDDNDNDDDDEDFAQSRKVVKRRGSSAIRGGGQMTTGKGGVSEVGGKNAGKRSDQ